MGLRSNALEYYSVRPLPVTVASPARFINLARRGPQKNDAAYNVRMAALYRDVVMKEKPVQSEGGFLYGYE